MVVGVVVLFLRAQSTRGFLVLVAVGCILTVVLNDELQFVETNDREWVILKDGITSSADAAAEGTRLVEEYVLIRLLS